jgi:hypothetical protein
MLADKPSIIATPRSSTVPASRIGLVTLWSIAVFVTLCLVALSLIYGAAERKRLRGAAGTRRIFTRQVNRPIASDV